MESFRLGAETFSQWTIPLVMLVIVLWGAAKRVPMYEAFVTGAKEGFDPSCIADPLFFRDDAAGCFVPLEKSLYAEIIAGTRKL